MQFKPAVGIVVFDHRVRRPNFDCQTGLFQTLTCGRVSRRLAGPHLTAGKLRHPSKCRVGRTLADEKPALVLDHGDGNLRTLRH